MSIKKRTKICIIGGGISGYAFAWLLSKENKYSITIIEKEVVSGGLAKAIKTKFGFEIDQFYHFLYQNDSKNTINFFRELGLEPQIIWNNIKSGVFVKNILFSVDEISSLMRVQILTLKDKLRFLYAMFSVIFIDFKSLDSIPSKKYLIKLFGNNNYKVIWEPLLVSKFTEYAKQIPASWIARRIQVTFFSRSLSGKTRYGYIKGTYNRLFRKIESKLKYKKVTFIRDRVSEVEQIKKVVRVLSEKSGELWFDKVVIATPINIAKSIVVNSNVKKQLSKYKELNAFVVILFLKKKFSDYFWINVNDVHIPFTGIIELTNLTGIKLFKGIHIVYLSEYISDKSSFNKTEFLKSFKSHLKQINSNFSQDDIIEQFDFFATGAAPIPFLNYMENMPPFRSRQDRIFLLNSSMIYPQDRGVGNSIKLAQKNLKEFINS